MNGDKSPIALFLVHWNQPDRCIETVRKIQEQQRDVRIVIIDNASTPESWDVLRSRLDPEIETLKLERNYGWGPALNIGMKKWLDTNTGHYCLISAHDADPAEHCISLLVQAMDQEPDIGIACPQYPDETVACFSRLRGVYQEPGAPLARGTWQAVDAPHGTLMIVRRECLDEIGLFDERYFAYGDEHELGLRARKAGWKVALVWGSIVANRGTWTPSPWRSYLFTRNSLLLVNDYGGKAWAWARAGLILLNTIRMMIFSPNESFAFDRKARWHGVVDYFKARYGQPPVTNE